MTKRSASKRINNLDLDKANSNRPSELLNATAVGKHFKLSSQRMNLIFAEIGWTEKAIKGWNLTSLGRKTGGAQFEHVSGGTYVLWPKEILENKTLLQVLRVREVEYTNERSQEPDKKLNDFRMKFPASLRTRDGHMVRSRAEVIIDNALYDYGLAHAYERKLPVEEDVYSDFYIPAKNGGKAVYIEYWGLENDPKYQERMKLKKVIYAKYDLNLIELSDQHIVCLDDHLPRMLLKYGIRVL